MSTTSSLVVRFVLISCFLIHSAFRLVDCGPIHPSPVTPPVSETTQNDTANHGDNEAGHKEVHRYHVAMVDFARVADPFVITGWILLASIAKIGKHGYYSSFHMCALKLTVRNISKSWPVDKLREHMFDSVQTKFMKHKMLHFGLFVS